MRKDRSLVLFAMLAISGSAAPSWLEAASPKSPAATQPSAPTRAQINAMIDEAGKTPPDWWDSVQLKFPNTLDLSWKDTPGQPWNPQKNVGQYLWDVINPNPGRWKEGVKFIHHVMSINKNNPAVVDKTESALAKLYGEMLLDYPRAAFWTRRWGRNPVMLANCYWEMGSKEMAVEELRRIGADRTRHGGLVKLWADMGELTTALKLAEDMARAGMPDAAYLVAGDACRLAGKYPEATKYYQKVLAVPSGGRDIDVNKKRAQASLDGLKMIDLAQVADGTYTNSSIGYAGPVQVAVTVKGHAITAVKVTQHKEKQFYSAIDVTTAQIIEKQGVRGVDTTSGATVTSEAILNAAAKALAAAQK